MKQIRINGGKILSGNIRISGAKNSAVALIPASLLSDDIVKIDNVPNISDTKNLEEILNYLNATISRKDDELVISSDEIKNKKLFIPLDEYTIMINGEF
mgnify:CR=1 FL=1